MPNEKTDTSEEFSPLPGRSYTLWHARRGGGSDRGRGLRALANLATARAKGAHVKLTVIAAMMGHLAVEGFGLGPACTGGSIKGQPPGFIPGV